MKTMTSFEKNFRLVVEKVFNHWPDLKLAVEHGMGGRNGQQTAIQVMNYTYSYCIGNENITQGELQDVLEDLMDQEFNTLCDDNSIPEICTNLLRYLRMCKDGKYSDIEAEFQQFPPCKIWLGENVAILPINQTDNSSSEDESSECDSEMDVDEEENQAKSNAPKTNVDQFVEPEPGWTTVRSKKKH